MLLRRLASQQILFLLYTLCSVVVLPVRGIPFIERVVLVSEKETLTPLR
ncbi:hypothetical protein [Pantoea coffeiphila]|nr:hypothetical protein [Pantoea coffeiphila]